MTAPGLAGRLRWLPRRDPPACPSCAAALERGAQWCGSCGARVGQPAAAGPAASPESPPSTPAPRSHRRTRVGVGAALLGLLAAVLAAGIARDPAPVALLGTAAGAGGQSASGAPPPGLRLAWSVPLVGDGSRTVGGLPRVAVGAQRLAVDDRVVDLTSGRLVATVPGLAAVGDDGVGVALGDGALLRVDVLGGTVVGRTDLPDLVAGDVDGVLRLPDLTVLSDAVAEQTVLVRDDGTVVARHPGVVAGAVDRAVGAPAAVSVRALPGADADSRLVATDDGRVVAEIAAAAPMAVDVVGHRALVATAASEALGRPGTGIVWGLRLLDATDGSQLARAQMVSAVAPRLLGSFDDGAVAIATRSGREVGLWRLRPDGGVDAITQLRRNVLRTGTGVGEDALFVYESAMLRSVAMVDGTLVLPDDGAGRAVALDAAGDVLWTRPAPGSASVAAGGEYVVLVDVDGRVRVLDVGDGADVVTLGPRDHEGVQTEPVAVLGTDLALAPPSGPGLDVSLGTARWVDVATGEPRSVDEVLGDAAPADDPVSGAWRLIGVAPDPSTGGAVPVVLRDLGRDVVQLLEPGTGFSSVDLDQPDAGDVASFLARVVGVAGPHVALWTDSFEGVAASVTHVVDRTTGEALHAPGVVGLALRQDLLLAIDGDSGRLLALDPTTGATRWTAPMPRDWFASTTADDQLLTEVRLDAVDARDLRDGRSAWRWDSAALLTGRAVLGPSRVTVSTVAGEVVALDRTDGTVAWRVALGVPVTALTTAGDDVLVGTADGLVVHLDRQGRPVQRVALGSGPVQAVAAVGATVVAVVDGAAVGLRSDGSGVVRRDEVDLP